VFDGGKRIRRCLLGVSTVETVSSQQSMNLHDGIFPDLIHVHIIGSRKLKTVGKVLKEFLSGAEITDDK
jgi:hypothetical protein